MGSEDGLKKKTLKTKHMTSLKNLGKMYNALEKLYNKNQLKPFPPSDIDDVRRLFKISAVFSTVVKRQDFIVKISRGKFAFTRQPLMADAKTTYQSYKDYYELHRTATVKDVKVKDKPLTANVLEKSFNFIPPPSIEDVVTVPSLEDAIKLLKENGYKIMKPVTEFKEI